MTALQLNELDKVDTVYVTGLLKLPPFTVSFTVGIL
jgi:hypothetical protein